MTQRFCVLGEGKLTQGTITKLQKFYTRAIRKNKGNLEGMHKDVWATYFHCVSTDDYPRHHLCPQGIDSWCFYNKALAYEDEPGPHKFKVGTALNPVVSFMSFNILVAFLYKIIQKV